MARRDSWPSYARLRVSGFSANLNYRSSGRGEAVRYTILTTGNMSGVLYVTS